MLGLLTRFLPQRGSPLKPLNDCPVCGEAVLETEQSLRLHSGTWMHYRCGGYRARRYAVSGTTGARRATPPRA